MAFRFGDPGGRMYQTVGTGSANLLAHWTNIVNPNGVITVQAGGGRITGTSLRFSVNLSSCYVFKLFDSQPTFGIAAAMRPSVLPTGSSVVVIMSMMDSNNSQCDLRLDSQGSLVVTRNGTVLGTAYAVVAVNSWFHVELKITFHPTAGTVYLAVNGTPRVNLINQNTRNSTNSTANTITVGAAGPGGNAISSMLMDVDDFIVYDAQPTDVNGYPDITGPVGDCRLSWFLPTAAGANAQFTSNGGANYTCVDDTTPDGDTTYVESDTIGHIDTYTMADLPANVLAVKSAAVVNYVRKSDTGVRGVKAAVRSNGGNTIHAVETILGNGYQYLFSPFGQDPNNGSPIPWTLASVNALEVGRTVSS